MDITVKNNKKYTLVTLKGKRLTAVSAPVFRKNVCNKIGSFQKIVILDLAQVVFIDSSGLGALVAAFKLLPSEGKLLLCGVGENVRHLFKLTRMDSIFSLYPDVSQAIRVADS